jgi:hypothetical protein
MTDETHLLPLIYSIGNILSISLRERIWSTECVDLVAPDRLVLFTDGSLCEGRTGAIIFFHISNDRESYALGSHATVFQSELYAIMACSEYFILEAIVNRAISI